MGAGSVGKEQFHIKDADFNSFVEKSGNEKLKDARISNKVFLALVPIFGSLFDKYLSKVTVFDDKNQAKTIYFKPEKLLKWKEESSSTQSPGSTSKDITKFLVQQVASGKVHAIMGRGEKEIAPGQRTVETEKSYFNEKLTLTPKQLADFVKLVNSTGCKFNLEKLPVSLTRQQLFDRIETPKGDVKQGFKEFIDVIKEFKTESKNFKDLSRKFEKFEKKIEGFESSKPKVSLETFGLGKDQDYEDFFNERPMVKNPAAQTKERVEQEEFDRLYGKEPSEGEQEISLVDKKDVEIDAKERKKMQDFYKDVPDFQVSDETMHYSYIQNNESEEQLEIENILIDDLLDKSSHIKNPTPDRIYSTFEEELRTTPDLETKEGKQKLVDTWKTLLVDKYLVHLSKNEIDFVPIDKHLNPLFTKFLSGSDKYENVINKINEFELKLYKHKLKE